MTSYCAANGLNQRKAWGGLPLIGPRPPPLTRPPFEKPAIVVQNSTTKSEPIVRKMTPKKVTTVAACVRCITAEMNSPSDPRPMAETSRTT